MTLYRPAAGRTLDSRADLDLVLVDFEELVDAERRPVAARQALAAERKIAAGSDSGSGFVDWERHLLYSHGRLLLLLPLGLL